MKTLDTTILSDLFSAEDSVFTDLISDLGLELLSVSID